MSVPVCKYFRSEQGCKFGNKCRYRHCESFSPHIHGQFYQNQNEGSISSPSQSTSAPYYPRQFFARRHNNESSVRKQESAGRFGFQGSHIHSPNNVGSPVNSANSSTKLEAQFRNLETSGHYDYEEAESDHRAPEQRPFRKVCQYFAKNGNCCFGSRCHFVHVRPNTTAPRFQRKQNVQTSASETDKFDFEDGTRVRGIGDDANFSHEPKYGSTNAHAIYSQHSVVIENGREIDDDQLEKVEYVQAAGNVKPVKSDVTCRFYQAGRCWRGSQCKFLHPGYSSESWSKRPATGQNQQNHAQRKQREADLRSEHKSAGKDKESFHTEKTTSAQPPRAPYVPQGTKKYSRDEVDDVEACRLRRNEIDALIKRFPKNKVTVHRDCSEYFQCDVSFSPTDPDWPFDVKVFQLQINIPADYPFEMMTVTLPNDQDLPETVRRYVEASIEEWFEDKEQQLEENRQVELVFRPFLRWLDRNIEDVVTEGLKQMKRELVARASGLEFISAKQLQKQYPGQSGSDSGEPEDDDDHNDDDDDESASGTEEEDSSSDYEDEQSGNENGEAEVDQAIQVTRKSRDDKIKAMMADPEHRGTEVMLKNLQLKEGAATLYCDKICLLVQCERCKGTSEFMAAAGRVNMVQCNQCSQTQMATYRPAMVHQFSSVIGYLDLDACLPYDVILQNTNVTISCLHCSKETKPGALLPGQPQDHWCRVCHHKLRVAAEGVRFTQLEPSKALQSIKGMVKVVVPTRKRIPKDPAIQEGKPLPNFGTCKHYKKSYRWLRFPCCGKCYPCDTCHDSKEDHEMTFANRMICGFCCKEQPFSAEKPCKGCDMNMTRVHTTHWEGGQGCRDKISMSRKDKAKHSNMSKTVSKHSQKVKDMQSKKKTKLRHA